MILTYQAFFDFALKTLIETFAYLFRYYLIMQIQSHDYIKWNIDFGLSWQGLVFREMLKLCVFDHSYIAESDENEMRKRFSI